MWRRAGENKQKEKRRVPAAKRKTGKRGEEKQGKEEVGERDCVKLRRFV